MRRQIEQLRFFVAPRDVDALLVVHAVLTSIYNSNKYTNIPCSICVHLDVFFLIERSDQVGKLGGMNGPANVGGVPLDRRLYLGDLQIAYRYV